MQLGKLFMAAALSACSLGGNQGSPATAGASNPPPIRVIPRGNISAAPDHFVAPAAPPSFDPAPPSEPFNPNGVNGSRSPRPIPGL